jgi:hypothetical protein
VAEETVWVWADIRHGPDLGPAEWRLPAAMPLHAITSAHGQAAVQ